MTEMGMDIVDDKSTRSVAGLIGADPGLWSAVTRTSLILSNTRTITRWRIFQRHFKDHGVVHQKVGSGTKFSIASARMILLETGTHTRVAAKKQEIDDRVAFGNEATRNARRRGRSPKDSRRQDVEKRFPESNFKAELKKLRGELKQIAKTPPVNGPLRMACRRGRDSSMRPVQYSRQSFDARRKRFRRLSNECFGDDEQKRVCPRSNRADWNLPAWLNQSDHSADQAPRDWSIAFGAVFGKRGTRLATVGQLWHPAVISTGRIPKLLDCVGDYSFMEGG